MKMPLRAYGVFLVEHEDAGGNAGAVKQIGRQADDAFQDPRANELLADCGFGVAAEQDAVGKDAGAFAVLFMRADDVQQIGVVALLLWRLAPGEALVYVAIPSRRDVSPVLQVLSEKGGLATT